MREILKIIARRIDVRGLVGTDELPVEGWLQVMLALVADAANADQRRLLAEAPTDRKRGAEELHHELARVGAAAAEALRQLERDEGVRTRPDEVERALAMLPLSEEAQERWREAIGLGRTSWPETERRRSGGRRTSDQEAGGQVADERSNQ